MLQRDIGILGLRGTAKHPCVLAALAAYALNGGFHDAHDVRFPLVMVWHL